MTISPPAPTLLIVEDSDEDYETTVRALEKGGTRLEIERCVDGDDALDRLYRRGIYTQDLERPMPKLILLDLNLPATDGREVLAQIKRDSWLKVIPVVVLTTSSNPRDVEACYHNGANSYLVKPVNKAQFISTIKILCDYWFRAVMLAEVGGRR